MAVRREVGRKERWGEGGRETWRVRDRGDRRRE